MKTLKFNFSHPFKGFALVNMPGRPGFRCKQLSVDSKGSNEVEIPLNGFKCGNYKITFEWLVGNQFYVHHQDFKVSNNPGLTLAAS
jgi:hypothetical protein